MIKKTINEMLEKFQFVRGRLHRNDRLGMLERAWGFIFSNHIKGAYYEFGLYRGQSFLDSWQTYLRYRHWAESQHNSSEEWRRKAISDFRQFQAMFYGFDTFEGIPANDEGCVNYGGGTFKCSQNEIRILLENRKVSCQLFKGLFAEIDPNVLKPLELAAIINIDSDLYQSAKDALALVYPKIQQGTVLLMDEYNAFSADSSKGERRALLEFVNEHPDFEFEPWCPYHIVGQSFICHVKKTVD